MKEIKLALASLIGALTVSVAAAMPAAAEEEFKVVTTFTVIADMARNVAGEAAIVESITKPGAEIHDYQPTPGDLRRARDADLILSNGLNLERWFERFLRRLKGVPSVIVTESIAPMSIGDGPYRGKPNPHSWMSEGDAKIYIANIRDALIKYDPENAETYRTNAAAYSAQLEATMAPLKAMIAQVPPEKRWLVSSEGAFSYLARDLGLKELFLWPINADAQGTPKQVRRVIDTVRAENIPVVFSESTISPDAAKQIARETDAVYGGVLYVDSLSEADGPVPTFLDLLTVTTTVIAEGLSGASGQ